MDIGTNVGKLTIKDFEERYEVLGPIGNGDYSEIFKILDKSRDKVLAMKITASSSSEIINASDEESSTLILLHKKVGMYTDCFPTIYDYGQIDSEIADILKLSVSDYEDEEEDEEPIVIFLTESLVNIPPNDFVYPLEMKFELIMSLYIMNENDFYHEDIHRWNIGYIEVDYERVYNINGKQYVVNHKYLPIILDWAMYIGSRLLGEAEGDLARLESFIFRETIDELYLNENKGLESIESKYFNSLRNNQSTAKTVKYFDPYLTK